MIVGYTTGVFDLFHVGHINLLQSAKALCDTLIVGVNTDELTEAYKGERPIIPFAERIEIVRSVRYVDLAIRRDIRDKLAEWRRLKFDIMFVGDDWMGDKKLKQWEQRLKHFGVKTIYLPYTPQISTSAIIKRIRDK